MNKIGEKVDLPDNQIFPPPPPDSVFQNKENRQTPSVSVATNYVTYLFDHVEYRDGEGIFTYYKGVELPRNGLPFAQAVYAINGTKRLIIHGIRLVGVFAKELNIRLVVLLFISKKKRAKILEQLLLSLIQIATVSLTPYYMKPGYYCKTAKEVWKFIRATLLSLGITYATADKIGEIFAMVFEYDDAYRYPLQDIMSETTKEKLLNSFPKEIGRLFKIESSREANGTDPTLWNRYAKVKQITQLLRIVWLLPSVRKAIKAGLNVITHENWQLDAADIYHTQLWADYNIKGVPLDERVKNYLASYDNDESKMPPRVQITVK